MLNQRLYYPDMLNFTWNLILEYVNVINSEKFLATFYFGRKKAKYVTFLSNVKDLLLEVLTCMCILSSSYYQCYNPRQWNSIHIASAFVLKSSINRPAWISG